MRIESFLELLHKNDVALLFYFRKSMGQHTAEKMANVDGRKVKLKNVPVTIGTVNLYIDKRNILVKDIRKVVKDSNSRNVIYVFGDNFTCALYVIKCKKGK